MASPRTPEQNALLARQSREKFLAEIEGVIPIIGAAMMEKLQNLASMTGNAREMQIRRDQFLSFQKFQRTWMAGTIKAWRAALVPPTATGRARVMGMKFELENSEVVENKILSSRLVIAMAEKLNWELNELMLRIRDLEGAEVPTSDILRPEAIAQLMVEQWLATGMSRPLWHEVSEIMPTYMTERLLGAYHNANEFLIEREVMAEIDLKPLLKRAASAGGPSRPVATTGPASSGGYDSEPSSDWERERRERRDSRESRDGRERSERDRRDAARDRERDSHRAPPAGDDFQDTGRDSTRDSQPGASDRGEVHTGTGAASDGGRSSLGGTLDETRMMTSTTPLARARMRAQGVLGHLKRLLTDRVTDFEQTRRTGPTPLLAQAMAQANAAPIVPPVPANGVYDYAAVQQTATALRQRSAELKAKASTSAEKATIEIVALMFQSILAEERIPASIRVWFARLQMPVLRVAMGEPEFFGTLGHPARQLIDRMGSSVMGFDTSSINGSAMENEIRRVVQVIEQYPETGRRVFQLVLDEFQAFLAKFLTESEATQHVVSVAQQVEQRETMAIQYTIELRKMLENVPVREEIREFLFKVWAEVLAMAAMKHGPQNEQTKLLKRSATDLVWAASAKPNRNDRARVIQDLPQLLQRLRTGMTLLGIVGDPQEAHIKTIGNTLADAFMSKTESIPHAQIEAMARRLANLEDFVSDEQMGDLPLDAESLELMLGMNAQHIEVIADGGSRPTEAMIAWVNELQLGNWFSLDHNGKVTQVQYVWRSDRKQLHLFASASGRSYLIQARRLASYLQAGLVVPTEEETLTVRATREALAKLDANPERLLD